AAYGWMHIIYVFNHQIITVKGRSDYYLQIKIIDKILIILSILVTYKYGVMAMIYGHLVVTLVTYYISNIYFNKVIDISLLYQFKNIIPFLVGATLLVVTGLIISKFILNDYLYLIVSLPMSVLIYVFVLWLLKVEELKLGWSL